MTLELDALCFEAHDPVRLAAFWAGFLGWSVGPYAEGRVDVVPEARGQYRLRFRAGAEPKPGANRIHLDLTSDTLEAQQARVARGLELGGALLDLGLGPDELHVPMIDPEGNELCVIEPDNDFLAGCGLVGCINGEGSAALGRFWSAALGWPLVWDQDEETAVQAPAGGSKMAWGGPPMEPILGRMRLHLDVAPAGGSDQATEVERLLGLGARRRGADADGVVLTDPDGNELRVLTRSLSSS